MIDATTRVVVGAEACDWWTRREIFVGYTSLVGGKPATLRADDLIEGRRAALSGYKVTQHVVTNHLARVDGDRPVWPTWWPGITYSTTRVGASGHSEALRLTAAPRPEGSWKVNDTKLTVLWAEGNRLLPELAHRRYDEGLDRRRY